MHKQGCIIFGEKDIEIKVSRSVHEISRSDWSEFFNHGDPFLSYDYFSVFEQDAALQMYYAEVKKKDTLLGMAYFQVVQIEGQDIGDAISQSSQGSGFSFRKIAGVVNCGFMNKAWNLLIAGNALNPSKPGFNFKELDKIEVSKYLEWAIDRVTEVARKDGKKVKATLVPGVMDDWSKEVFTKMSFRDIDIEPEMVLEGLSSLKSFDDYLNAMSSKYRVRTKKAYKKSADLKVEQLGLEEIKANEPQLYALYSNVIGKAQLCLHKVDGDYFSRLKSELNESFQVQAYWHNNEIIGFITWFVSSEELHAHLIGLNYELNRKLSLYQRILYDLVDAGIKAGCNRVIFGRTAPEMKSTIGAEPIKSKALFKSNNRFSNAAIRPLRKLITQPDWEIRQPFKVKPGEATNG